MPNMYAKPKGQNDNRGRSRELWLDCPIQEIRDDFSVGYYMEDDFISLGSQDVDNWDVTNATAGTAALNADVAGGEVLLDSGATTATQGVQMQWGGSAFKPKASSTIWFETLMDITGIANLNVEMFAGLAIIDDTIIATSAYSTTDHIGFGSVTDDGVLLVLGEKAGTADNAGDPSYTITSGGKMKLGFKVTGITKVEFWINGVQTASTLNLATANIPIVGLCPSFVCQTGGTDQPIMAIDWVCCYQEDRAAITLQASA